MAKQASTERVSRATIERLSAQRVLGRMVTVWQALGGPLVDLPDGDLLGHCPELECNAHGDGQRDLREGSFEYIPSFL